MFYYKPHHLPLSTLPLLNGEIKVIYDSFNAEKVRTDLGTSLTCIRAIENHLKLEYYDLKKRTLKEQFTGYKTVKEYKRLYKLYNHLLNEMVVSYERRR